MSDEVDRVRDICTAFGDGQQFIDETFMYVFDGGTWKILVTGGRKSITVFDNGLWHISGDARAAVMELRDNRYLAARKLIDEEQARAQREYAQQVDQNNSFVLNLLRPPLA